jgi:probable F420-dependent oxidoreductase
MLAKEAATLDVLSGGRFELGLGAGWLRAEYEAAGIDYAPNSVRVDRLAEAIAIIKGLRDTGPITYAGEHYRVTALQNYPPPVQRPGPPLLIGAGKRRMLRLAGQHADIVGFLTTSVASGALEDDPTERLAESVAQKITWVREGAGARFEQIELSLIPTIIVTEDRDAAIDRLIAERGWSGSDAAQVAAMPAVLIGTLTEIAATIRERRDRYGFSYYIIPDAQMDECAPLVAALAGQ